MAILMGACALVFNLKSSDHYLRSYATTGLILTAYGFLQATGKDPVGWTIDYNPFITTLGNPNFTSGFLGLSGIAIFLLAIEAKDRKVQISWAIGLIADLYILKRSGSIQGLFGFLLGAAVIILVKLWLVNRKYGQIGLVATALAGAPVGLAILNIGPLASRLYQGTLANRLDYWNAALNMFKDYPIFGVGIDRYGEYYRQYAVQNQVVQGQITDNAHSVYLQLLATGGLITFVPYVALIFFVTYIGLKALIRATGPTKLRIGGILGIWLGTVAVNIVTIDNLGVAVWFWITGGVLIAVSVSSTGQAFDNSNNVMQAQDRTVKMGKSANKGGSTSINKKTRSGSVTEFPVTTLIASGLAILILLTLLPILGKSQAINELKLNSKGYDANTYVAELNKQVSNNQNNSQNLILLADVALRQGEIDLAYKINDRIREIDPRSFYGHYLPALAYEASSKPAEAKKFREKLIELDPWNTSNMLQLIKDYLAVGDKSSANKVAEMIKRNYPGSQSDIDASALLVG
jgi:O-antigen ligase